MHILFLFFSKVIFFCLELFWNHIVFLHQIFFLKSFVSYKEAPIGIFSLAKCVIYNLIQQILSHDNRLNIVYT